MQSEFCTWQNSITKSPQKRIYSEPAQETAKHPAKFRWPPLSDIGAVTKARCKTSWNLLGCSKQPISAVSGPKFTILWGRAEEILLFNNFFSIVDTYLSCENVAWQNCAMVRRWRIFVFFLHPVFSASRMQHISDLHSKFALRQYHVQNYGRHLICGHWKHARKKRKKKKPQE